MKEQSIIEQDNEFLQYVDKFGEYFTKEGVKIACTQQPYIQGDPNIFNDEVYVAHAIDEFRNDYEIQWLITNEDCEDESDACDWTKYKVMRL